ncbi:DAZ-associated protein 1-like isoform X2 [Bolinopsis microptera]|uniref:DAZ-associated protein 1-like isoform X2 n=1 Tax=Bolinopsis microptera TaxID=2820187 RepID=UPI0030790CC9
MASWNKSGDGDDVELILRKLFVGGIKPDTSDDQFRNYFAKFGDIEDYVHIRNKQTGQSKGFGFVTYSDPTSVDKCLAAKPHTINQKDVDVKRAVPKDQPQERCHKIFVGGLPETNEAELKAFFEKHGKVTQCQFKRDQNTGRGRGFGFVSFEDSDTVDKLVILKHIEFNGKTIECKKALDVKDKQHMGGHQGGHNQNPSVYGAPPAAAGYGPPPGYPAPPMPAYGAYPPYGGYGGAPAQQAPTAPGYSAPAAAPSYPAYPGYPAQPAYPQPAPGYPPAPAANPYYPQQPAGQYNQAPSSYGAQKNTYASNTYGSSRSANYKPY